MKITNEKNNPQNHLSEEEIVVNEEMHVFM